MKDRTDCNYAKAAWNMVDDYVLSKFQGKHGNDSESYGDIKKFVGANGMSVVSIRNRTKRHKRADTSPVTLSEVVGLIEAKYPGTVTEHRRPVLPRRRHGHIAVQEHVHRRGLQLISRRHGRKQSTASCPVARGS